MSSTAGDPSQTEVELSRAEIRAAYNPFEHGCWLDFANKLTQGYMQAEYDDWSPLGDHHEQWLRHLAGEADVDGDLALLCHRDGLKTTIITAFAVACLEYLDGYRVIWAMNTMDQAYEKADRELNKFIDRNPWLLNLNKPRDTDSKKTKEFANGSSLTTGWLKGAIEGARAHLLILDDIIKEQGDGETESVLNWVDGVAQPMVKDDGRTVMVGTRKRPDDIYNHYRDYEGYALREFPAILDTWDQEFREDDDWQARRPDPAYYTEVNSPWRDGETLQLLWPEARGPEWLADKRTKMADYLFWREYTLTIQGASGNLIEKSDVDQLVDDDGCSIRGREPPRELTPGAGEATVVAHDPAQSDTGDLAAFVAFRVGRDGRRRLLDAHAAQGMQPSEIRATLMDFDDRFDPAVVVIESNGMQQYVANDAVEFSPSLRAKVTGIPTTGRKHSWENGIPRLRTLVEQGGIQFYRGHGPTEDFIQAALSLTLQGGRLEGHTPDYIAAWYMAEQGIRRLEEIGALDGADDDADDTGVSGI
ncbi:hypothetical protein G9C85_02700 [Halorubellus sp. JP-L1]|uniref:phage terminase large subunit family protein n=1 Tax=Halorubellus sp. JP-L1 TaxID=2715753 RepID=UPI00140E4613|nr:hypothetical protein [Halorubellus sp. JP-L1]NHN40548.1 hypothetical protein [Halorubellus sp. JP-L1]